MSVGLFTQRSLAQKVSFSEHIRVHVARQSIGIQNAGFFRRASGKHAWQTRSYAQQPRRSRAEAADYLLVHAHLLFNAEQLDIKAEDSIRPDIRPGAALAVR